MTGMLGVLLDISLRACVAAVGVGLALAAFRVRSAALRHAAWAAVLAAMLLMAPLRRWGPAIPLPVASAPVLPESVELEMQPVSMPIPPAVTHVPALAPRAVAVAEAARAKQIS